MITPDGEYNDSINAFNANFPTTDARGIYLTTELEPFERFRRDVPILVVRPVRDNGENPSIDHFVDQAIQQSVPLTFINYPKGQHGFDHLQPNERSREIIKFTLEFLALNLDAA